MERPSSPARSTRSTSSNLIRSYTTSSDLSASEQLAAIAKAREERKKQRQGMERNDTAETLVDDERGSVEVIRLLGDQVEEEESKNSLDLSDSSSRVPKLRIQPTSDRSYTPSVPSSPSRSSEGVQLSSNTPATTADPRIDSTTPRPASPARNAFVVSDIPPFRPRSASPTPASPVLSPIRSSSPTNVVLAGGLLERLKAQRAAQIARTASESGSPTPSTLELDQTSEGSLKEAKESSQPASTASPPAFTSPPFETSPIPASALTPLDIDRPPSLTRTHADSISPLTSTSTAPSSFVAPSRDEEEGNDAVSDLSTVFSEKGRSKSRSRIYGRYGEEIEYDFTALSDVAERSERSSMSTMQGSLFPSHRRQGSAPISDAPSPIRYSTSSSALSNRILNPIASSKSSPSLRSIRARQPDSTVNRRIDATSQLLGCSNADARSIFDGSSIRSKASLPSVDSANEDPTNRDVANRSPIKHTSPEIARRASQFELPASPTKATFPPIASAHRGQVPANNFGFAQDDPLKEIEQRRNARRARIESIRNLYAPRIEPASPRTDSIRDEWTEVERKEQAQAQAQAEAEIEIKNIYRPTGLVAPFPPISQASRPLSPQLPTFCEGYLSVPPGHDNGSYPPQHHPTEWVSRYSVLNSENLSFRPTDQNSLKGPIIALDLSECDRVDEEGSSQSLVALARPFSVVLKSGERVHFACEKGSERVRWIVALQDAIKAAGSRFASNSSPAVYRSSSPTRRVVSPVARTLTPPGSTYSPSRGTLYRDQAFEPILPPLPFPTQDGIYPIEKQPQSPSVWSRSASPLKSSRPFGSAQQNKIGTCAFDSSRLKHEQEALPRPLPNETQPPPSPFFHEVISTPERSRQEHSRSKSDFSIYRTRNHEAPFRPSPTRPLSMRSESTITYQEHQPSMNDTRIRAQQVLNEIAPDSTRPFETETLTTRRGIDSASEKVEWNRRLQDYEHEARHFDQSDPSSVPSPNFVRRERQATSRKLEGLEGVGKAASGFRLPLGKKRNIGPSASPFIDDHSIRGDADTRTDPFAKSQAVQPQLRRPVERSDGQHSRSSRSDPPLSLEELIWTIRDNLENQRSTYETDKQRQEMQAQAISALAHWVTEDTHIRHSQYKDLAEAVEGVVQHVANLPQQLLAVLQNSYSSDPVHEAPTNDQDELDLIGDAPHANGKGQGTGGIEKSRQLRKNVGGKGFGLSPNSSFARAHRQFESADQNGNETKSNVMKPKGPRMPGIRLWGKRHFSLKQLILTDSICTCGPGAPDPSEARSARCGGDVIARDGALNDPVDEERTGDAANGPLLEALGKDTRLAGTLEALANGEGTEIDAGTLSHAVFEILQTLREIGQKQTDQAARQAEEQAKSQSLTDQERAELVAKKEEIARIEQSTAMNAERTAKINELVAQLAQRTDKTDALLAEIAKSVKDGKTTKMDPALSNEVKKLLGGVQSGVEAHVSDFRGKLTSEVQRMFKEVGKLRDEKKTLQSEIAELMAFHAKHGGLIPKPPAATVTENGSHSHAQAQPQAAMTSGFFGPRAMK